MIRWNRADLKQQAGALWDQQLWCWGRDITRREGNILIKLGMERHRAGRPYLGRSLYRGRLPHGAEVWLWGFGILYCAPNHSGLFLSRTRFDPLLVEHVPNDPVYSADELGPTIRPSSTGQLTNAMQFLRSTWSWVAQYEHLIAETYGVAYREAVLAARNRPPVLPAREQARAWDYLVKKCDRLFTKPQHPRSPWGQLLSRLNQGSIQLNQVSSANRFPRPLKHRN